MATKTSIKQMAEITKIHKYLWMTFILDLISITFKYTCCLVLIITPTYYYCDIPEIQIYDILFADLHIFTVVLAT